MSHLNRNNPRTVDNLREKIKALASSASWAAAQYEYAYRRGWICALYWADIIDVDMQNELLAELDKVLEQWQPCPWPIIDGPMQGQSWAHTDHSFYVASVGGGSGRTLYRLMRAPSPGRYVWSCAEGPLSDAAYEQS